MGDAGNRILRELTKFPKLHKNIQEKGIFFPYILLKIFTKQITNSRYLRATLQLLVEQGHEEQ